MAENNNVIGSINGTKIKAGTPAGAAYVNKVTHPPSPMSSTYQGRPDCSQPNVVLLELKSEQNISPILTVGASATTTKTFNPSSILFLQSSGNSVGNYVFMFSTDSSGLKGMVQPQNCIAVDAKNPNVAQQNPPCTGMAGYNFINWPGDVGAFRTTYKSSTYYLNATDFNNQGTVTTAKFKPNTVHGFSLTTLFEQHAGDRESTENLRRAVKSSLAHYNANSKKGPLKFDDDNFEVIPPNEPGIQCGYQIYDANYSGNTSGVYNSFSPFIYCSAFLPSTASELLMMSPKAATRPAREGAFVVQQQEGETLPWVSNYNAVNYVAAQPAGLLLSFMRYTYNNNVSGYIPMYSSAIAPGSSPSFSPFTAETQWNSLDWSYTLFEGLTVPTTTGTTLSSVPYITVKTIVGMEIQPKTNSSLQPFMRTLPLPDPDAINMAVGIMHARPDSLPAAANDLGTIAATAIRYIPAAVGWLKNLFGSKKSKDETKPVQPKTMNKTVVYKAAETKAINNLSKRIARLSTRVNKEPATKLPTYVSQPEPAPQRRNKKRVNYVANASKGVYGNQPLSSKVVARTMNKMK